MNPATIDQPTAPVRQPAAKAKPKARTRISRFPFQFHYAINIPMQRSIERLTGINSLMDAAQIGRLSLHLWLAQNDMQYREEVTGNRSNGD
jgi:hypothetical protein